MSVWVTAVLGVRFLLETGTISGLIVGALINKELAVKISFIILAIVLVIVWARYGAPKSPDRLVGISKLILELIVYGLGSFSFYYLFAPKIGTISVSTSTNNDDIP